LERELPEVAITNESILLIVQDYWKHCKYLARPLDKSNGISYNKSENYSRTRSRPAKGKIVEKSIETPLRREARQGLSVGRADVEIGIGNFATQRLDKNQRG
jgi:hypothetical protein